MSRIVLFGTKAFAEMAHYFFTHDSDHSVVAFTVDGAYLREPTYKGLPVVPFEELHQHFPPGDFALFIAVGIQEVNRVRARKVAEAEARGYQLVSFVSSSARVHPDLVLQPNTMIMEHVWMHPFVEVGRNTILWSASRIAFRGRIGDHCWITSALLGEAVAVGDYSFVGLGATIAPCVAIGKHNVIGAGALILKDTNDYEVYRAQASTPAHAPSNRLWTFGRGPTKQDRGPESSE